MKPPPDARWHAYADGVGHAFLVGKLITRSVCGQPRLSERFDHPIAHRCEACTAELNRLTNAALMTEGESRIAWGNR